MAYLLIMLGAYTVQTVFFRHLLLRPDLFLILLLLFGLHKKRAVLILSGFSIGLFLDIFSGYAIYYTLAYSITAAVISFFPYTLFRDDNSSLFFGAISATIVFNICMSVFMGLSLHKLVVFPAWYYIAIMLINAFCIVLFFNVQQWLLSKND